MSKTKYTEGNRKGRELLHAFFTPLEICEQMWEMADVQGIEGNPLPKDKPKSKVVWLPAATVDTDKAKKIRIAKAKINILAMQMNQLNGVIA